jgi:hypothetical protein
MPITPLFAGVAAVAAAQGVVADRLVAVVSGQPIMASDLRAVRALDLIDGAAALDDATLIDRLVVRELMRAEVERFSTVTDLERSVPVAADAASRTARVGEAGLAALGLSPGRLSVWLEDDVRIQQHVRQRFEAAAQPSEDEALTWFQIHERDYLRDGRPRPFADVRDEVRARLVAERRQSLVDDWIAGLRRRAIVVLAPPSSLP